MGMSQNVDPMESKPWSQNSIDMFIASGFPPPEMVGCSVLKAHRRWLASVMAIKCEFDEFVQAFIEARRTGDFTSLDEKISSVV